MIGANGSPAASKRRDSSAALKAFSRLPSSASSVGRARTRSLLSLSAGSAFRSSKPSASQNVSHCASLTAARKICSSSFTVNTSYIAHGLLRAGIGAGGWPVIAYCSMCWPTRNTLFSNSADCTSMPRR